MIYNSTFETKTVYKHLDFRQTYLRLIQNVYIYIFFFIKTTGLSAANPKIFRWAFEKNTILIYTLRPPTSKQFLFQIMIEPRALKIRSSYLLFFMLRERLNSVKTTWSVDAFIRLLNCSYTYCIHSFVNFWELQIFLEFDQEYYRYLYTLLCSRVYRKMKVWVGLQWLITIIIIMINNII